MQMTIFTIGFTQKSAEYFFNKLKEYEVKHIVDTRLNNTSQFSGFSKKEDLKYFAKEICNIGYTHILKLAPTKQMRKNYKNTNNWETYEIEFLELLEERQVENMLYTEIKDRYCLLCSEHLPDRCHRRLITNYLIFKWPNINIEIVHII